MVLYNDSFMNNATNVVDLLAGLGTQMNTTNYLGFDTSQLIGIMIMVSVFIIFLALSYRLPLKEVMLVDSFATTVVGILLFNAGLVNYSAPIVPFVIFVLFAIWSYFSG